MASLKDYWNTGDTGYVQAVGSTWMAQSFTAGSAYRCTALRLKLYRNPNVNAGTFTVRLRATDGAGKPTGPDLASCTRDHADLGTDPGGAWYDFGWGAAPLLTAGTKYAIIVSSTDGTYGVYWRIDNSDPYYTDGVMLQSTDSGATWSFVGGSFDALFETWGNAQVGPGSAAAIRQRIDLASHRMQSWWFS